MTPYEIYGTIKIVRGSVNLMDSISILSVFTVSFPEALAIGILGLLAIGKHDLFKSSTTIIRIILFSLIFASAGFVIRRITYNTFENVIVSSCFACVLFIVIVKLNFYESIVATFLSIYIIQFIVSTISMLVSSLFLDINQAERFASDLLRFEICIPQRILEILLIILFYHFRFRIIKLDGIDFKKREYIVQLIVYIISLCTFVFLIFVLCDNFLFKDNKILDKQNFDLLRLNVYLSIFVIILLTLAIKAVTDHYKAKSRLSNTEILQNIEYMIHLIDEKKYNDAREIAESIKTHVSTPD